jgi:hypothetical protein
MGRTQLLSMLVRQAVIQFINEKPDQGGAATNGFGPCQKFHFSPAIGFFLKQLNNILREIITSQIAGGKVFLKSCRFHFPSGQSGRLYR